MVFREEQKKLNKIEIKLNKPVYLGLLILQIIKTLMYELWYDYIKPKYQQNAKICYTDIWILIVLLLILKLKMFKTLQMVLEKDLTHQFYL